MNTIIDRFGYLLASYCLDLKEGQKVYVKSSYLAEPLLQSFYKAALERGAHVFFNVEFREQGKLFLDFGQEKQLSYPDPFFAEVMETFDAYLYIMAPFNLMETQSCSPAKRTLAGKANARAREIYNQRTASGQMKRCLTLFPTQASAQEARMSLSEYENFVFGACNLFEKDPESAWINVRKKQQNIVDTLNNRTSIRYVGKHIDVCFSTKGRTWINSDGRSNMPSGEVYTSPVEESVNGWVYFTVPAIFNGKDVEGVRLNIKDGLVTEWSAEKGMDVLNEVFAQPGARNFGEMAVGTNYNIQQFTRNILFDEKIGGTIHMAVGQSYLQAGGKNTSTVHWDLITDMTEQGEIYADDELVYRNGKFLI